MLLTALALAAQAAPAAPATPTPAPRPPIQLPAVDFDAPDWTLARAPGSCAATARMPGGGRLLIAYHGGQNLAFVSVIDPALGLVPGNTGRALVRFGPLPEESIQARANAFEENGPLLLNLTPARNTGRLRGLAETGTMIVTWAGHAPVSYTIPGAREGVPRLLACAEEARGALPADQQLQRAWLNTYFSVSDYPRPAVLARQQGTVRFWVKVSAEGRVTDCQIIQSSGTPLLDETTCNIIRERARYEPVRDAQGQPIPSYDGDYSITWRLPEPTAAPAH